MYGTQFRRPSAQSSIHSKRTSDKSEDRLDAPYRPQRPQATTTGSQIGRFSYLGNRGAVPGSAANVHALAQETRLDSPAMTTNDELYAPLAHGADIPLGGSVHPDAQEPRQRFGRTPSSFA
jgi:aquaporin related protein